jgi:hypothetical protein
MSHTDNRSGSPRFRVGDKVRVKRGVIDPDFPDMPLGGWTGTVTEIIEHEGQFNCVFKLDDRTLASLHPIYRRRCERDGLDFETMGPDEKDLEPDDGTPVPIEQPTQIRTPPLSMDEQDDRIRAAFGLTHDDLLPEVDYRNQHAYYRYLWTHLSFPFRAKYWKKISRDSNKLVRLTVTGLYDFDDYDVEEGYGLIGVGKDPGGEVELPLIEIEDIEDSTNRRLIQDYAYWVANWQ